MKYIAYSLVLAVTLAVSQAQGAHHAAAPARAVVAATTVAHASAPHAVHPTGIQAAFQASCSYTVQPGDTLNAIAARFNLTWPALYQLNRSVIGADPDVLVPGEQLTLCGTTSSAPVAPQPPVNNSPVNTSGSVQQMIIQTFGAYSAAALAVARCESGYDPNAWNPVVLLGSHAEGVFQILYPATWKGTSYASYSPYNAWANIQAAHEIFVRDGYSWREWACKP